MTPVIDPSGVVRAIREFFAKYQVASLELSSGWFGRPYDNWHNWHEPWDWTSYGGSDRHRQQLGAGLMTFHAPFGA